MKTRITTRIFTVFMSVLMLIGAAIPAQAQTTVDAAALEEAILAQAHGDTADTSEESDDTVVATEPEADDEVVELFDTYSGTCGDNLTWTLDTTTGVLTISGTGAMTNWSSYIGVPWYSHESLIKTCVIEAGVTTISDFAFFWCSKLTNVIIPDSVTSIGESAFDLCTSLTNVTIPMGVTTIDKYAFEDCTSLKSVTIPKSVVSIGLRAFSGCKNLINIAVDEYNAYYSSDECGVLFNKDKTKLIQYPIGNVNTTYSIPDGVLTIAANAFYKCDNLTNVTMPDSVTTIGSLAFSTCEGLTSVKIPSSVTSIDVNTFFHNTSLMSVTIPESVTKISMSAFVYCTSLTDVYYTGTEDEWSVISIDSYNDPLTNATIHYNYSATILADIDGDGAVAAQDSVMFSRFLAGWTGYTDLTLSTEIADLDSNGAVDAVDSTILSRHLATWSGYDVIPLA